MSAIRKTPYIETLINGLTSAERTTLLSVMNSEGINKNFSLANNSNEIKATDKGIYGCTIELAGKIRTCILIYNDTYCVALCYHRFQDMDIFSIDPTNKTFIKINEDLTIFELRMTLELAA